MDQDAQQSLIRSGLYECVAEGAALGMSAGEISRTYGILYCTANFYLWAWRYPDRFLRQRERVRLMQRAKTKRRGPYPAAMRSQNFKNVDWPAADEQRLRQLMDMDYTYGQIALAMGRSRNAIAGKVNRLRQRDGVAQQAIHPATMARKLSTPA